jgi:UDP-2,4-diacetamido-2,4,6-trideoxy-beta-L-altropyranose hydrolase
MSSPTLAIRSDANVAIGTGHVMRCLALAQAWQDAGGDVVFVMAESTPSLDERLAAGHIGVVKMDAAAGSTRDATQLAELAQARGANYVAVDGYQFDAAYQRRLKDAGLKLLFIDDNGDAEHYYADLVLNQNAHAREDFFRSRQSHTRLLLGPRYALLRREFASWREWKREIHPAARKVLVTMGGSDPDNVTLAVIHALPRVQIKGLEATVVVGGSNPHITSLEQAAAHFPGTIRLQRSASNMAELLAWADVAVSGAGTTCWEMCLLGLPAILIDLAENQRPVARELDARGVAIHLGSTAEVFPEEIAGKVEWLLLSPETRAAMSGRARKLVDGKGAGRVVAAMKSASLHFRRAQESDCEQLWAWANDPLVRAASFSQSPIPWEEHRQWFAARMKDPKCLILIGENGNERAVGQFRIDWRSHQEGEIDVNLAPQVRGRGYGSQLIDAGVRQVFATTGTERVHAFIRPENQASIRAFEQAHFTRLGEEKVKGQLAIHYVRIRDEEQS